MDLDFISNACSSPSSPEMDAMFNASSGNFPWSVVIPCMVIPLVNILGIYSIFVYYFCQKIKFIYKGVYVFINDRL